MKLETLAARMTPLVPLLRCPLCGAPFTLPVARSLLCEAGHCYDLSAKGYVNLAPGRDQRADPYDAALFASRARVFADGFYAPVAEALCALIDRHAPPRAGEPFVAVDAGCGEGFYARALAAHRPDALVLGIDLNREAILAAARQTPPLPWLVADLTRLPLRDSAANAVLDVLTPADYRAFARVLKPEGLLYKAIPADDYLGELRLAAADNLREGEYHNARVVEHIQAHTEVLEHQTVRHTYALTPLQAADFKRMTPLTFGLTEAQREAIPLTQITVAMELFACRPRR